MPYVDGFVVAVPKNKIADYKKMARKAGKVWREHGAPGPARSRAGILP